MSLKSRTKQELVAAAHSLQPIVIIGNQGLSENVIAEIDRALYDHELIKVRVSGSQDKGKKKALVEKLGEQLKADCLKIIGHIVILYRPSDKKKAL